MRSLLLIRTAPYILLLATACLSACATMRPDFETPSVTVTSFRMLPSNSMTPEFEIGLKVTNPNAQALSLRGVAYTVSLDGTDLVKGVANELPVIEGYGSGDVTLTASPDVFGGIQFLAELMSDPRDSVTYSLEAKLDVGSFVPAIRVRDEGEISLQPTPR
jgi:LEA14-like dessication related protein